MQVTAMCGAVRGMTGGMRTVKALHKFRRVLFQNNSEHACSEKAKCLLTAQQNSIRGRSIRGNAGGCKVAALVL